MLIFLDESVEILEEHVNVTQFLGLIMPQAELNVGGTGHTILQVPSFAEPVVLNQQVGWPGEILKVTVFRSSYSPAQGALGLFDASWEVVFPLAVGLRTQFYPRTIGTHHGELLMLAAFQVESEEGMEYAPGIGSVVWKRHTWTNDWIPKGKVMNQCVFPVLEEYEDHSQKWYRCQLQALRDGTWFISDGRFCRDLSMWKASWNAPAPGLPSVRGVAHMVTDGLIPEGFVPLRRQESQVETEESGDESEFEIIDVDE